MKHIFLEKGIDISRKLYPMSNANLLPLIVMRNKEGKRHLLDFIYMCCKEVIRDEDVKKDLARWLEVELHIDLPFLTKTRRENAYFYGSEAWSKFHQWVLRRLPKNEGDVSNWVMVFFYHYYNPLG